MRITTRRSEITRFHQRPPQRFYDEPSERNERRAASNDRCRQQPQRSTAAAVRNVVAASRRKSKSNCATGSLHASSRVNHARRFDQPRFLEMQLFDTIASDTAEALLIRSFSCSPLLLEKESSLKKGAALENRRYISKSEWSLLLSLAATRPTRETSSLLRKRGGAINRDVPRLIEPRI